MKKIIPKLGKLPLALRNGYLWFRVQTFVEKKEFGKALRTLDKMLRTKTFKIEIDLMKAQIFNAQSRHDECIALARTLTAQIESSEKLSIEEKKYCVAYSRWLADLNEMKVSPERATTAENFSNLGLEKINLANVADHWKSNFPLRIHPEWKDVSA